MRESGKIAKKVLEYAGSLVKVSIKRFKKINNKKRKELQLLK